MHPPYLPRQLIRAALLVIEYHRTPAFLDVSLRQLGEVLVQPHVGSLCSFSTRLLRSFRSMTNSSMRDSSHRSMSPSHSRESSTTSGSAFRLAGQGQAQPPSPAGAQPPSPAAGRQTTDGRPSPAAGRSTVHGSAARGCALQLQRELSQQKLLPLPPPRAGNKFHLFVSMDNSGATSLVGELLQRQIELNAPSQLKVTNEPDDLIRCERMLLYLNGQTWATSGAHALPGSAAALGKQIRRAMTLGVPLLLVHERPSLNQASERFAVPFESFLSEPSGATPQSLVRHGIYREIACPMMGGSHRLVSFFMLHTQLCKGVRVRSVLWVTLSDDVETVVTSLHRSLTRSLTGVLNGTASAAQPGSAEHGRRRVASVPPPRLSRLSKVAGGPRKKMIETVDVLGSVFCVPAENAATRYPLQAFTDLADISARSTAHSSDGSFTGKDSRGSGSLSSSRSASGRRLRRLVSSDNLFSRRVNRNPPPNDEHETCAVSTRSTSLCDEEAAQAANGEAASVGPLSVLVVEAPAATALPTLPPPPPHPSPGIPGFVFPRREQSGKM